MTHLPMSTILNAVELMIHLKIQCCLDDSSADCDIAVSSKKLLFHKGSPLLIIRSCSKPLIECDQSTGSETSDSSGDVTWRCWQFQCKFPIHIWLIYLTSFLDESSTPTYLRCFTMVKIGRWLIWKHFSLHSVGAVFTSSESTVNLALNFWIKK